jgi:hypothetical protein
MSGWENVPEEAAVAPPAPRKPKAAAQRDQASSDAATLEDGELARLVDEYWPHAWLLMLSIVSAIGIWAAVGKLPNPPTWWP